MSSSAGMQLRLQRELFDPAGEQLLAMVQCVVPAGGEHHHHHGRGKSAASAGARREVYLCLLNQVQQSQFHISIAELKGGIVSDEPVSSRKTSASELPKRKRTWSLKELTGLDAGGDGVGFELEFERGAASHAWTAAAADDKKRFLSTLINLSARHDRRGGKKKLTLANLPEDVIVVDADEGLNLSDRSRARKEQEEAEAAAAQAAYEPISSKEAADLTALMAK